MAAQPVPEPQCAFKVDSIARPELAEHRMSESLGGEIGIEIPLMWIDSCQANAVYGDAVAVSR